MAEKIIVAIGGGLYFLYILIAFYRAWDGKNPFFWDDWFES